MSIVEYVSILTNIVGNHFAYKSCHFLTQSAHDRIVSPPNGYDTIVQTMGICSTGNPTKLLNHLGSITNPNGGRILLLEHGRGFYQWFNWFLDKSAPRHADKFGCWHNKDIGKIVKESDLQVVSHERYYLGSVWKYELKPKDSIR